MTVKALPSDAGSYYQDDPGASGEHKARAAPGECPAAPPKCCPLHLAPEPAPRESLAALRIPAPHRPRPSHWPTPGLQGRPAANRGRGAELRAPPDALSRCGPTRWRPQLPQPLGGALDSRGRPCRSHCWEPRARTTTPSRRGCPRRRESGRGSGESRWASGLWVGV